MLIDLLFEEDCNVDVIRNFFKSRPNFDVNSTNNGLSPLHIAIYQRLSLDVVEELLKNGADANARSDYGRPLQYYFRYGSYRSSTKEEVNETVGLLLRHGADVNWKGDFGSVFVDFTRESLLPNFDATFESGVFYEALRTMMETVESSTVAMAVDGFLRDAVCFFWKRMDTEKIVRVLRFLMRYGVRLNTVRLRYFFRLAVEQMAYVDEDYSRLFGILECVLPYTVLHSRSEKLKNVNFDFESLIELSERRSLRNLRHTRLMALSLHRLYHSFLWERDRLGRDFVSDGVSVLDCLRRAKLCRDGQNSGSRRAKLSKTQKNRRDGQNSGDDVVALYGLLLRLACGRVYCFGSVLRDVVENGNLKRLYEFLLWKHHGGRTNVIPPDCLENLMRFLKKEDVVNFLISLVPL